DFQGEHWAVARTLAWQSDQEADLQRGDQLQRFPIRGPLSVKTGGPPIAPARPALNAQTLFRSRAGKQTPAWYFEHRIPLDSIDFDFRRALACSTFQKSGEVFRPAHF